MSSAAILDFLQASSEAGHELHSFMMARHGRVIAEGWWAPYRPNAVHSLYSLSKSFTSTAVGFAVAEGRLSVEDRVATFFPQSLPVQVSNYLATMRVRDLLMMSSGHANGAASIFRERDWIKAFLELPIENAPGSIFHYDGAATYMLSAIVQKLSAQRIIDYLRPRLFEPFGADGMTWDTCPLGINAGGWGLKVTTETILKLGQLYLQKGAWNGQQLLPASWIDEATGFQIQQPATWLAPHGAKLEELKQNSDWHQGYGYQFWRCRYGAVRGDGAFGQFCIMMPREDAVIAITSSSSDLQGLLNLVWEHLLHAAREGTSVSDRAVDDRLAARLSKLTLPLPSGSAVSPLVERIGGRRFEIESNLLGIQQVVFEFHPDGCLLSLWVERQPLTVRCGFGKWVDNRLRVPGGIPEIAIVNERRTSKASGDDRVAAAGAWKDDNVFEMRWCYFETPHHDRVTCRFDGQSVEIEFLSSIAAQQSAAYPSLPRSNWENRPVLRGRIST